MSRWNEEAVVSIPDGTVIEGSIRSAKMKLVQAWIEIHQDDLIGGLETCNQRSGSV